MMAAVADKVQPFDMLFIIYPVIALAAFRLGKQALFFVLPDGHHLAPGLFGHFANFHISLLPCCATCGPWSCH